MATEESGITLTCGDCLEFMRDIPTGSVDMVLADLPYGTTRCKWDSVIPFAPLWEAYKRVCKPSAAIVLTASQPFTSALVMSNPDAFRYDWTWQKPQGTGHLNAKKQPLRDKEDVLVFYAEQCTYNPQFASGTPYKNKAGRDHSAKTSMTDSYGEYTNFRNDNEGKRYPKQVLQFGVVERGTLHPTQKPVALMEYLIKTYTNPGELVLDNTMGSGTTGVACLNTGRRFIGIEKDTKYFEIARNRILSDEFSIAIESA
jgi:site-specific DNA-methyltransferase (adenine-specific)